MEKTIGLVKDTEGMEEFRKALASEDGVILLIPHLSNWEVFGFYVGDEFPTTIMYQPPKNPRLDRLMREARSRSGIHMAPTNRKGVAQVLAALQRGELFCILPDQVPPQEGGVYAPFFGEQAFTMTLVSRLIMRTGARVFCGFAKRLPRARGFKVIVKEANELIYSEDLEQSAIGLNKSVEQCVEIAIAQYQWEYKRFRRRPDGEDFYQ